MSRMAGCAIAFPPYAGLTVMGYRASAFPVAPHWASGSCSLSQSAKALIRSAFFYARKPVYGGCRGGASARRSSDRSCKLDGIRHPFRLAATGGGSLSSSEDTTMSQDKSALLPVSFLDTTLYIIEHNNEPYAPIRPIIKGMGLTWQSQQRKIQSNNERWGVIEMMTPSEGGPQKTLCMPPRKLPAFFANIHPNKVRPEPRPRIVRFQNECDDVLWAHYRTLHPSPMPTPTVNPEAILKDRLRHSRWLVGFDSAHPTDPLYLQDVPNDTFVMTAEQFVALVGMTDFPRRLLPGLLAAIGRRMGDAA